MNKKILLLLIFGIALLFPVMTALTQEETPPAPTTSPLLEITGVNASALPTAFITTNVFDTLGQPVTGLSSADFTLSGELASVGQIIRVESVSDDNLPISAVLVIDISDSMSGFPLQSAKDAAIAFVNSLGDADSVAIVTFADKVTLAQDYTTDKAQLIAVIDGLQTGGRTALYSAGVLGVETVVNAPSNRRVVVLLSDGSEYGGASTNAREEALALARQKGASFYTIGLGYGADRTYLEELSNGTNGAFFESPEADQLVGIYTSIAENLRSEYIITVEANVPLDGTAYRFDLQANTPEGASNIASSVLITPVPIPVIKLGNTDINLADPLTENVQLWYLVMADDRPLTIETTFTTNGITTPIESELFDSNYVVTIRPRDLAPGDYVSTITATDSNGDSATLDTPFIIANIPSEVTLTGIAGGQRFEGMFTPDDMVTLQADVTYSQTPVTRMVFFLDGQEVAQVTEAPYVVNLPLLDIGNGRKLLEVFVETESGQLTIVAVEFFVDIIPTPTPTFTETPTIIPSPTASETLTITPSPTYTLTPTETLTYTPTPTETADVFATETFIAQQATESSMNVLATQEARATDLQNVRNIRATRIANNTATIEAVIASSNAFATQTAIVTTLEAEKAGLTATVQAQGTALAEITMAIATATQFELDFRNTERAVTETAVALENEMTATRESELATVMVLATETALIGTQTAQAELDVTATYGAYFTETFVAAEANMTSTAQAIETEMWQLATATASTATAQAELEGQTLVAQVQILDETATASFDLTSTATEVTVRQTLTAMALTATEQAVITQTAEANIQLGMTATAQTSLEETATAIINSATETAEALNIQATQQMDSATQTALAQPTSTPQPTLTPITELTEVTAPDAPAPTQAITDFIPLICAGLAILGFLMMVLVVFVRRNQE
jgi:VWFA-related protein